MGDFNLPRLQRLWNEYIVENVNQTAPEFHILQSLKLTSFENEQSHTLHHHSNAHHNNFRFVLTFTIDITAHNKTSTILRCQLLTCHKEHPAQLATEKLVSKHLTDSPMFEITTQSNPQNPLCRYEPTKNTAGSVEKVFFATEILRLQSCTALPTMTKDIFTSFVECIWDWIMHRKVSRFRINHLKLQKKSGSKRNDNHSNNRPPPLLVLDLQQNIRKHELFGQGPSMQRNAIGLQNNHNHNHGNTSSAALRSTPQPPSAKRRALRLQLARSQQLQPPTKTASNNNSDNKNKNIIMHEKKRNVSQIGDVSYSQRFEPSSKRRKTDKAANQHENGPNAQNKDTTEVRLLFYATMDRNIYEIVEMKDVSKCENASIYEKILAEKCRFRNKSRDQMEGIVWHGCYDLNNIDLIIKNGFDRSYNTRGRFGKGTYFARDAAYSANPKYCGTDKCGVCYLLLCRAIIGDYTVGQKEMEKIPRKEDGKEYDTLVDSKKDPSIFVVWRDYHAVPWYLVKYKKQN